MGKEILVSEQSLAMEIGVAVSALTEFRKEHLFEDEDWIRKKSGVLLTVDGAKKTRVHFGLQEAPGAQDGSGQGGERKNGASEAVGNGIAEKSGHQEAQEPQAEKTAAGPVTVTLVVRMICINSRMVECEEKGESGRVKAEGEKGKTMLCRVNWSRGLHRGQELVGCIREGDHWFYPRLIRGKKKAEG